MTALIRRPFLLLILLSLTVSLPGCKARRTPADARSTDAGPAVEVQPEVDPLTVVKWSGKFDDGWKAVDKLINEQKLEAAAKLVEDMLAGAKEKKNSEEWVRCLIRTVQLRTGLHGYETSVRFLKEQPWPEDLLASTTMHLYYAASLVLYARSYSWEINKREKVASKGPVDLKAWTMEQIYEEAQRSYDQVWKHRKQLGDHPVKVLAEHLQPNSFPEGIRPSLRDAVSYLWVELLANTTGWRPEHSNQIYQLDLPALLGDRSKAGTKLTDPEVHPLAKIAFVLDDLESWHAEAGQAEAAFEARLERLRRLHTSFSDKAPRAKIKADLRKRLADVKNKKWWSMGMASLAEFVRAESEVDNLIRARDLAIQGENAFPASIGGKRCKHIIASIESPAYQVEAMATDGSGKRSVGLMHKNLDDLYFRAYRLNLKQEIEAADDYGIFPHQRKIQKLVDKRKPDHKWKVSLSRPADYKQHRKYVFPPITKPGLYAVVASAREGFGSSNNVIHGAWMIVSDLVIASRTDRGSLDATIYSGRSGQPVRGAAVMLYRHNWKKGHRVVERKTTGADGRAHFGSRGVSSYFLFAKKGDQASLDPSYQYLHRHGTPKAHSATMLFTDRSIYRPTQTLHFKAVVYRGQSDKANYKAVPKTRLTISLMDPNNQKVASKTVTTNKFGSASGTFVIPTGRLLGQWRLQSSISGQSTIKVEEYKRPTFEAELIDPDKPLRLNREALLKGKAKYYFGLPVTNGTVRWKVNRSPVYPYWYSYYYGGGGGSQSQRIATGVSKLKDDGTFEMVFTPEADESKGKDVSYSYAVEAEVVDEGGETRTASRTFRLGFVAVAAHVDLDVQFLREDVPATIKIVRTDLNGAPMAGVGKYRVVAMKAPPKARLPADQPIALPPSANAGKAYRTEDDQLRPRWSPGYQPDAVMSTWKDGASKAQGSLKHDAKGNAEFKFPKLSAGAYRIKYETKDAFGAKYEMSKVVLVAGTRTELPLPAMLRLEKSSVKVGDTARVMALSGLDDQALFLDVYRKGKLVERRALSGGDGANLIEFPISEAERGGFGLALTVVRDHQLMQFQTGVFVPWDDRKLKVEFSTFRDLLRPGAKETWKVKLTAPDGKPLGKAAAEVLAYMYDRSLDAFTGHSPPSPMSLWPSWASAGWVRSNLGSAPRIWLRHNGFSGLPGYPGLTPDRLRFFDNYGIGGVGRRRIRGATKSLRKSKGGIVRLMDKEKSNKNGVLDARDGDDSGAVGEAAGQAPVELRTNFSETAFFHPHLLTDADGSVAVEFEAPDSVTSWNVWIHALTADLKSGSLHEQARTVKELMVRPYLPRFLREGDKATLKVVVNNASERELTGKLKFDIIDPDTEKSLLSDFGLSAKDADDIPFAVKPGGGTNLSFAIKTPAKLGLIAFKVTAISGDISDGELRPIPVLPGRMHLAQSRFTVLKDKMRKELTFEDMAKNDDPSLIHEQLVVTLDAQLFYSVLSALPYLVNYPYECTEQTLNRFLATGILTSMYEDFPAVAKMAKDFSKRDTRLERFDAPDPNRKMALEETPWLQEAQGGRKSHHPLINVLDPRIARAHRVTALSKLKKAQTSAGAFPWFPGGPPSPYITLYILHGFSKALEFGVDVPKDVTQKAWRYMHRHYVNEIVNKCMAHDGCWEFITFLNYVLSNYPDTTWTGGVFSEGERDRMLDFSFKHWKQHSPYLKGYLALTLARRDRAKQATLVWESVMDSAKETEDQGTFWAPEDRAWLWYNDTIETHAFALRTTVELTPKEPKLDGMVLWLFINKKLNHWKSTKATSEVIYSLAHYLKKTGQLGAREETVVTVGDTTKTFVFSPDKYTGKKNQIVVPGEQVDPKKHATTVVETKTKAYQFASATWHFSTEKLPTEARGDYLGVTRKYFKRIKSGRETILEPLAEGAKLKPGDEVEVQLSLTAKHKMGYVHLRDPRPAGFEPTSLTSRHRWNLGIYWYEEVRDSGQNFFFEHLPVGNYPFKYRLRAAIAGTFKASPATVQPMYAPEFVGYSSGRTIQIQAAD